MKNRLFIGFDLSEPLKKRISNLIKSLKNKWPDLKYVKKENLHLTLIFLGQISDQDLWQTIETIQAVSRDFYPLSIESRGVELFPTLKKPKIISLSIKEKSKLNELKRKINDQLAFLNIARRENRIFRPHITLARIKKNNNKPDLKNTFLNFEERFNKIDIFESRLTKQGLVYNIIQSIKL
ncbi:MAG: RNA 2',3'-cyclic phosphodiesterase [Patescibacteria group bacterium]|nr:RNA 2',3'-cyclic phosphodiesterase [Patescibacteria group bacterium]